MRSSARFVSVLAAIAVLALGLRLLHVWSLTRALGTAQIHDAAYYHDVALSLLGKLASSTLTTDVAFANVGYPHVLSWIYRLAPTPVAVLIFQAFVGAATTVVTGIAGRDCFASDRVGLYAAALCAVYAPCIFYDGLLLTPSLSALACAILACSSYRALMRHSWRWAVVAGVAIASAALLRASQMVSIAAVSLAFYVLGREVANRSEYWTRARPVLALWLSAGLCMAPLVLGQWHDGGQWAPPTANGGSNFWIGNHRGASGTYANAPFLSVSTGGDFQHTIVLEREEFLAEARRRTEDRALTLRGADAFWWQEGQREIGAAPLAWLKVVGQKLLFTFNGYEPRTNASFDLLQELSPVLRFNPLRFGLLVVLAVLGASHLVWRRDRVAVVALAPLALIPILTCVVFFVSGEYRHPAFPVLALFAAFGIRQLEWAAARVASSGFVMDWRRASLVLASGALAFQPIEKTGPAKDRKTYAEALATRDGDGTLPTSEQYTMARSLLLRRTDSMEDRVLSAEAMLLVLSNQAIGLRERAAAEQLIEAARELWHQELRPDVAGASGLDVASVTRIRGNLVRRVAQLARQPFVREWPDIERTLAFLGGHGWLEVEQLLAAGEYAQADTFLSEALTWAPHAVVPCAYRGQLAILRGEDPTAWLDRSLDGYPKLALPATLLARHLIEQHRTQDAIAVLQAAVRERAYDETLRYTLGSLMHSHASGKQMLEFFSAALSHDEKTQTSLYFIALGHLRLGDREAAIGALQRALALDPAHEMSQRTWGLILERQGKLAPALEHLVEATRIHPEFSAALADVARLAERLGHPTEAAQWRERARLANPDTQRRYFYWARYLHAKGHDAAALNELARRLADAPRDAEALELRRVILGAEPAASGGIPVTNESRGGAAPSELAFTEINVHDITRAPHVPQAAH
jgi:tetratricopeptide (TPR) repeat protein